MKKRRILNGAKEEVQLVPAGYIHRLVVPFNDVPEETIVTAIRSQNLEELDLGHFQDLSARVLDAINDSGKKIVSLNLGKLGRWDAQRAGLIGCPEDHRTSEADLSWTCTGWLIYL